jgi:hypothetical protein
VGVREAGVTTRDQTTKDEIIAGLVEARECILVAASAVPAEKQDEVFLGVWSMKELLAHLVGWDYTNLQAAQEILEGRMPSFYAHRDRGWKSYNESLVARYRREDYAELLASVAGSHRELIAYLRTVPAKEFDRDRGLRAGRYKVTIARLLRVETDDEKKHCAQIREFLGLD